jgi:cell division protein FtsB
MSLQRALKRGAKQAAAPLIFLALTAYFLWSATQGAHGLGGYDQRQQDLAAAQAEQQRTAAELAAWQRRVGALHRSHLDPDALDERSRAMLNLSDPADIIVPYGNGQRLF